MYGTSLKLPVLRVCQQKKEQHHAHDSTPGMYAVSLKHQSSLITSTIHSY